MMLKFDFLCVNKILFGRGQAGRLGTMVAGLGQRVILVYNGGQQGEGGVVDRASELLREAGLAVSLFRLRGEPTIDDVDAALDVARQGNCDVVVGLGGGSAVDCAKAVAGLLTNGGTPLDYMEVIGRGQPLTQPAAPWIAVPTTAGTGAEVTKNAVLGCPEKRFKASLRSEFLLPNIALVDPELGIEVPPAVTARSGMDALCQLIESYTSNRAHLMTDALALQGIVLAAQALPPAVADGRDVDAREAMALAALYSGITLANVGLGAVHGFAAPAGANYPIPHGVVCARLLPPVVQANVAAIKTQNPQHPLLQKYEKIGQSLTGRPELQGEDAIDAGVEFLENLVRRFEIPPLSDFGLRREDHPELIALARKASSMRYNPVELTDQALLEILQAAG